MAKKKETVITEELSVKVEKAFENFPTVDKLYYDEAREELFFTQTKANMVVFERPNK